MAYLGGGVLKIFLYCFLFEINKIEYLQHNEHCRDCGKQGNVLLCDGCEACYHMECTDLDELPHGKWLCKVCEVHEVITERIFGFV